MGNIRLHSRRGFIYRQPSLRVDPNRRQATHLARTKQVIVIEDLAGPHRRVANSRGQDHRALSLGPLGAHLPVNGGPPD